jgi:acyl-CoA thioester hydrolase
MPREKLVFPTNVITTVTVPVRITDINYGNHLGNDSLVSILHEARMHWLTAHGISELKIDVTGLIMAALSVDYRAEVYYGDNLEVELAVSEIGNVKFGLCYRVCLNRDGKRIVAAIAETTMVSYDYSRGKAVAIPHVLLNILKGN